MAAVIRRYFRHHDNVRHADFNRLVAERAVIAFGCLGSDNGTNTEFAFCVRAYPRNDLRRRIGFDIADCFGSQPCWRGPRRHLWNLLPLSHPSIVTGAQPVTGPRRSTTSRGAAESV
jgi:hypothetical protein